MHTLHNPVITLKLLVGTLKEISGSIADTA